MATINLELLTSKTLKKEKGRHPINIIVRKDNLTPSRKKVGVAFAEEWDSDNNKIKPKGRPKHVSENIHIEDEFDKYSQVFKVLDRSNSYWFPEDVFRDQVQESDTNDTFYQVSESYMETFETDGMGYDGIKARFEKVKRYTGKDFKFEEINERWIAGFIKHCKTKEKNKSGGIGNSKNTINHAFRFIKRVVSFAGKENQSLKKLKISDEKNIRAKLTLEEMTAIENLKLNPGTLLYHSKNIYLVQFYLRGMRIGDALRLEASDFIGERLLYGAHKTGKNYNIKLVTKCQEILSEYMTNTDGYIFPFLRIRETPYNIKEFKSEIKNRTMIINKHLKDIAKRCGIEKTVTTHIARHSFATIADKKLGGDLKTLQALFGHSSRKITEIYLRDLRQDDELDDAADKILG